MTIEFCGGPLDGRREPWGAAPRGMFTTYVKSPWLCDVHIYSYEFHKMGTTLVDIKGRYQGVKQR